MIFSNTTTREGIVQLLEDYTSTQSASTSSYPLATKTRDINLAFADFNMIATAASGTWQADDSNHTKYPNMKFDLVSGQQDYSFTEDEQGNQVLDIYRVEIKDPAGNWVLLTAYDENQEKTALGAQETVSGTPRRYYKTANGIFLDSTPNYNSTLGIRMWFGRTPDYFLSTDTTKEPGIPQMFHRYLAIKPAYWYWAPKDSQRATIYFNDMVKMEESITLYYNKRKKDEKTRLVPRYSNYS